MSYKSIYNNPVEEHCSLYNEAYLDYDFQKENNMPYYNEDTILGNDAVMLDDIPDNYYDSNMKTADYYALCPDDGKWEFNEAMHMETAFLFYTVKYAAEIGSIISYIDGYNDFCRGGSE